MRRSTESQSVEVRIESVALKLTNAIRELIDDLPGAPHRPQELARTLGINKDLSSRVLSAARRQDAFAAVHAIPGPAPLRQLVRAAGRKGASEQFVNAAEAAIREFENLIRNDTGDRAGLEAIIGARLPDAREKLEINARQAVFRGTAAIKGLMADTALVSFIVHPSAQDPNAWCDTLMLGGFTALRRLRPGALVRFTAVLAEPEHQRATLDGASVTAESGPLLSQFCSPSPPPIGVSVQRDRVQYDMAEGCVGPRSAVDVFLAEHYPRNHARYRQDSVGGKRWFFATVEQPVKTLVFDIFLHESVWPNSVPELRQFDTTVGGVVDPNDAQSDNARLDLADSVSPLGRGLARFRVKEIPNYLDMLRFVCAKVDWNVDAFRAYRCKIPYPFYGAQICMLFDPPAQA